VEFARFVDQITEQTAAMRAAAVAAGPDAATPTCPEWTVRRLVRHLAKVQQWSGRALLTAPDGESPHPDEPPAEWDGLLAFWDEQAGTLVDTLRKLGPDVPTWIFDAKSSHTAGFWARRQAHEVAIHRLDAEHALAESDSPDAVPTLVFDPPFAADGIEEGLVVAVSRRSLREGVTVRGTVLFHAADAGRAWLVRLTPGEPLEIGAAEPGIDADASVVGTADAVYRAVWSRPSTAVRGGDGALIAALRAP
jgi:uncharacterized protein (TIGR03083 family)